MTAAVPVPAPRSSAGRRPWIALAVLLLPTLLASLELTVPQLALPSIAAQLRPSAVAQLWLIDVYGFVLAGSLITMGAIGDRIGRRRLLLLGMTVFAVLSLAAAFAPNTPTLILVRAALGLAGATLMPSALALAAGLFADARRRSLAIGLVIASVAAGTAVGPVVGGWLLEHFWWGAVFLVAVPLAAVFLVAGRLLLPAADEHDARPIDAASSLLALVAVLACVYGLKSLANSGASALGVTALVISVPAAWIFVARQRRLAMPLVDLAVFGIRRASTALLTLLFGVLVLFGLNFFAAQYLQLVLDLAPLRAGLWTAPPAVGVIVGSSLAPVLARRVAAGPVIAGGLLLAAAGLLALTRSSVDGTTALPLVVVAMIVVSLGLGAMMALSTDLVVSAVPASQAGSASGLSETAPELGGALGIAILGSVGGAVFRARLDARAGPDLDGADTVSAATALARRLPGASGDRLITQAQLSFLDGFHVVAGCGAAVLVVLAVTVALRLRRDDPSAEAQQLRRVEPTRGNRRAA